jgi:hypothetical protein
MNLMIFRIHYVVKSDKFDLTVFGFKCGLIDQIIKLINRL